jgi:hypothetical protein
LLDSSISSDGFKGAENANTTEGAFCGKCWCQYMSTRKEVFPESERVLNYLEKGLKEDLSYIIDCIENYAAKKGCRAWLLVDEVTSPSILDGAMKQLNFRVIKARLFW